jgi:tetratricopeptide (TPR) repeat protein
MKKNSLSRTSHGPIALAALLALFLSACWGNRTDDPGIQLSGDALVDSLLRVAYADPGNLRANVELARLYVNKAGQAANEAERREWFDKAEDFYVKALSLDSCNFRFASELADVHIELMQSEKALRTLERAAACWPDSLQVQLSLADIQYLMESYEASNSTLKRILARNPYQAEAHYLMGRNLEEMKDTLRAINSFQTAVEENPELIDAHIQLGLLFDRKRNPLALKYYDNVLRLDSMNFDALFNKGWYFHQRGKENEMLHWYREAATKHPDRPEPHFQLGLYYYGQKNWERSREHFDRGITVNALTCPGCFYYRGKIAQAQGRNDEARKDFEQAVALDPDFEEAKKELGEQ